MCARERHRPRDLARWHSDPEARARAKARQQDPAYLAKERERDRNRRLDPGVKDLTRVADRARNQRPEVKARAAARCKLKYQTDPHYRDKILAKERARMARPEVREAAAARDLVYRSLPEIAEKKRQYARDLRNDEAYREYQRSYMRDYVRGDGKIVKRLGEQRRRARLRDSRSPGVTPQEWEAICKPFRDENGSTICAYCRSRQALTIDHVVPISRGGRDEPANVLPACSSCNASKGNRLIHQWHRARALLSSELLLRLTRHTSECLSEGTPSKSASG